eukprot:10419255-Prorocentrum_lima.AAC.1
MMGNSYLLCLPSMFQPSLVSVHSAQDPCVVGASGSGDVPFAACFPVVVWCCVWGEQPGTPFPMAV